MALTGVVAGQSLPPVAGCLQTPPHPHAGVADFRRNRWPPWIGISGQLPSESLAALRRNPHLGGKVVLLKGVPDWQLAQLYSSCRFTFFPSHYEGWGLPVTESLAFGKLCLASNRGGIPEAGGAHCVYFDPGSADEAEAAVRGVIESASLLHQLTARVRAGFQEVTWSATAREVLAAVLSPVGPHRAS